MLGRLHHWKIEGFLRHSDIPCQKFLLIFAEFLKSIVIVLKEPVYTITMLAVLVNMIGYSSTMSFAPKYMEKQFNVPAWKVNIILGNKYYIF